MNFILNMLSLQCFSDIEVKVSSKLLVTQGNSDRYEMDINDGVESKQMAITALGMEDVIEGQGTDSEEKNNFEPLGTSACRAWQRMMR